MRLLEMKSPGEFSLVQVATHNTLPYAILSHTWTYGQEVTYEDVITGAGKDKTGYEKIKFCGEQAAQDGLQYFWVDTCCIDKSNSVELTTAINSMFRWYQRATKCYVYLADVSSPGYPADVQAERSTWETAFRNSKWFTRGWTLQELIAPVTVDFFSKEGKRLGNKKSLEKAIHEITRIPIPALYGNSFSDFGIAERKEWAVQRHTTEEEDIVYCLLGLCEVSMPPIYGEGEKAARKRLEVTIREFSNDANSASSSSVRILEGYPSTSISFPNQVGHPVTANYRKVHVTVIHWKVDQLGLIVERISHVFRLLYNYEVRDIPLAWEDKNTRPWWTSDWTSDTSSVELEDLQIVYYLGSITHEKDSGGYMNMRASPFIKSTDYNDLQVNDGSWMSMIISFPNLVSDSLVVLDCYAEGLKDIDSEWATISHATDDDHSWTRYAIMVAGYIEKSTPPGTFSEHFMSLLEELTRPDHPRSRFRPSDVTYLAKKLNNKTFKGGNRMEPEVIGNGSIFLVPTSIGRR